MTGVGRHLADLDMVLLFSTGLIHGPLSSPQMGLFMMSRKRL